MQLTQLKTRNDLPKLLTELGYTGWGVEVGVWRGDFSARILTGWNGSMYGVDSWCVHPQGYRDLRNQDQQAQEEHYQQTLKTMFPFGNRYQVMRMSSVVAAEKTWDGSLDWIYLDANHHYDFVKADLEAWYPKIHVGGLLSGHDYLNGDACNTDFGVKQAVEEFVEKLSYKPQIYVIAEDWPSWYFLKEAE
jgi:hypothetical protein